MATALQTLIDAYIKRNGNQEITGPILNGVLKAIADALATPFIGDDGYWYIYDADTGDFVRTDTQAEGPQGPEGPEGPAGPSGIDSVWTSVEENGGALSVVPSYNASQRKLTLTFKNIKGDQGDPGTPGSPGTPGTPGAAAGFGTPTATIDANTGTPSVQVAASGPDTAKVFAFTFKNLKGAKGDTGNTGAAAGFGTPSATVDANTGTPAVTVNASGPDTAKVFSFAFHNLKGAQGSPGTPGAAAGFGTPTASVDANTGTPSVVITPSGPDTAKVFDFAFHNLKGATGSPGAAAGFGTPTASVDANTGTPSVVVTPSGPDTAKVFDFAFHNLKGDQGDPGESCAVPVATAIPAGGMKANTHYDMGTVTAATTISLDTTTEVAGQMNIYSLAFRAGSPAPTITWPAEIIRWAGNCLDAQTLAPVITAGNSYEISIADGLAVITEFMS